jgi:transposase
MDIQCWRCGVDFDPTPYLPGAPCADCQLDEPMYEWVKFDEVKRLEEERKARHIKRLWARRYSDYEIGQVVGMARATVRDHRYRLGLEAHTFTGDEKWKDPEAVRRQVGDRMRGNNFKQGWGPGQKHGGGRPHKLTDEQMGEIISLIEANVKYTEIAKRYHIGTGTVSRIKNGGPGYAG